MKKLPLKIFILLIISTLTFAHEFWLQPQKFFLKLNEKTNIDVYVGENYAGKKVDASKFTVSKLTHYGKGIEEDFMNKLSTKDSVKIEASFSTEGNHLVAFNNTNKFIELKAAKFNEYLKGEGLENIIKLRKQQGKENADGREFYQRCVKTLFQVGDVQDETYKQNTGMRLEVIALENPYLVKDKKNIQFKILFENKAVTNALVLAWHSNDGKTTVEKMRSNKEGEVIIPITKTGRWMISTVKMIPITNNQKADYQSFWGSYTFGFY
jgi:uncharacterized GH25 family protein